jgi:hypothetical protein
MVLLRCDRRGRGRLGAARLVRFRTLARRSTFLYWLLWVIRAVWPWAIVSMLLGLGFTFFSGRWGLARRCLTTQYEGTLEAVMAGQMVGGAACSAGLCSAV